MKMQVNCVVCLSLILVWQGELCWASFDLGQDVFLDPSKGARIVTGLDAPQSRRGRGLQQYSPTPLPPDAQQVVTTLNGVVDGTVDPTTLGLTVDQTLTNIQVVSATGTPLSVQQVIEVSVAIGSAAGGVETYAEVRNGILQVNILAEAASTLVGSTSNAGRRLLQSSIPQRYVVVGNNKAKVKVIQTNLNRILNNPDELSSIASTVVPGATASTFGTYDPTKSPKLSSVFDAILYLSSSCDDPSVKDYGRKMCNYTLVDAGQTTETAQCTSTQQCSKVGLGYFNAFSRAHLNVTLDYIAYATNVINERTAKDNAAKIQSVVTNQGTMTYISNRAYRGSRVILG